MIARTIFALVIAFAAVGCAANQDDSETATTEAADLSTAKLPKVAGTFQSASSENLGLGNTLTFDADGTYSAGSKHGTWKLTAATKAQPEMQITLDGSKTFLFSIAGNTMTFNVTANGATAYFYDKSWTKKIPIGDLCDDGHGKSLGECSDSGNFGCSEFDGAMTCNPLD